MKISCISDTHGRPFVIPECDIFIHAGDITAGGSLSETALFAQWLRAQDQVRHIVLVPGNHDEIFEKNFPAVQGLFDERVHILIHDHLDIEGLSLFGSAYTPEFMDWFFMADESYLRRMYQSIPGNLDILITHGPPFGILDPGFKVEHAGYKALLQAIEMRYIKHHIFGHLHAAGGKRDYRYWNGHYFSDTHFYNVAAVDKAYNLVRQPLVLEI